MDNKTAEDCSYSLKRAVNCNVIHVLLIVMALRRLTGESYVEASFFERGVEHLKR